MKRIIVTIIGFGALFLANTAVAERVFDINFSPAFHPKSRVSVADSNTKTILVFHFSNLRTRLAQTEEHLVDKRRAETFFERIEVLSREPQGTKEPDIWTDGIGVNGTYVKSGREPFVFRAWSPSKQNLQRDYEIIAAFFTLIDTAPLTSALTQYVETLKLYFEDLGLPVTTIDGYPFKVRFYGGLSPKDAPQLAEFIKKLPDDRPLIVDMGNPYGMPPELYPYFRNLLKKNKNIKWIATGNARRQLVEIGISESDIFEPTENVRK